ncbi:MAG TPA: hypothetical protein VIN39_06010 [Candidatus Dormibacteraeota bacterium]|jgi:hypothetical protein
MELDACPPTLGLDPGERNASQYGRLIEGRFIETIELSAARLVEGFRPLTDTGGYDWAGCPYGVYDALRLLQFKGTLHLRRHDRADAVQIIFDAGALTAHRNTLVLFGRFDPVVGALADPLWLVPSLRLPDVAKPHYCRFHRRTHLHFIASPKATSADAASRYQVDRAGLARAIFNDHMASATLGEQSLSPVSAEEGDFFEFGFATRFLRDSDGTAKLLRPDPDLGRDVLGVNVKPFHWGSLAIKGTALRQHGGDVIAVLLKTRTFVPHRRHFILVQYFDRSLNRLHEQSWLIPSIAFARLANHSSGMYQMVTSLNPSRNRWARYAIPTEEDAATFMRWMRRPPA